MNPLRCIDMPSRRKTAFLNIVVLERSKVEKYMSHLKAYKEWAVKAGYPKDDIDALLVTVEGAGGEDLVEDYEEVEEGIRRVKMIPRWLKHVMSSHISSVYTREEIIKFDRVWERGRAITVERVAKYVEEMVSTIPDKMPTILQRVAALIFWVKIETILFGRMWVPAIRDNTFIKVNLETL